MESSCVPVFPISSGNTLVGVVLHPLPIDFREVSKLSEIEQTRVGAHFECIRETRGEPVFGRRATDPEPTTTGTLRVTSTTGAEEISPLSLKRLDLTHPDWELLGPSVVIRRRPKRMQGLRLA